MLGLITFKNMKNNYVQSGHNKIYHGIIPNPQI